MENKYDKYKDSGIEWIGEIPEHWEVKKLGHLYIPRNEKVSDQDYPALSVTMQGILLQLENVAKTNDGDNRKLVRIGDFAINSRSDRRGSCGISKYDGSVSLINTVLTPINDMNPVYYEWLFHSSLFSDEYYRWGHGIVNDLWTTRWQEMKNIQIASPPLQEQQAIATYLDQKCGEIDELIALQEEMITKLQSYKQSVITEAVTKGLDKNAPLKDSGIEWIGEIPEHWDICQLKRCSRFINGYAFNSNHFDKDYGVPVIRIGDIVDEQVSFENIVYVQENNELERFIVHKNDILIAMSGATVGKIGIYYAENKAYINQRVGIIRTAQYNFIKRMFATHGFIDYVILSSAGSAQPNISSDGILNFYIPMPLISEQQSIADYLDQKCGEIDELISIKQQKIEKLKDYKKSLIFECVTGKRKVC